MRERAFARAVSARRVLAGVLVALSAAAPSQRELRAHEGLSSVLRVCADPNNLPFSHADGGGFENRIAELVAEELGVRVEYFFWAQRRGFFRNTLRARRCDVVMGVPVGLERIATTAPYYRSSYAFVTAASEQPAIRDFDDPRLRQRTIAVELVGDDGANTPPAHALARRGITDNVTGFMIYGDYSRPQPHAAIFEAVADGSVDLAVVWGPLAGYQAARSPVPLTVTPVEEAGADVPMSFELALGVRREDEDLRRALDRVLAKRRRDIDTILRSYGVPRTERP